MRNFVFLCVLVVAACGRSDGDIDEYIGAACSTDRDCDAQCFQGGDFPGGFCSLACDSDNDCPTDTLCMSESGGVCMFICPAFDCDRLGPGWRCDDKSRKNGGDANVCTGQ